MKCTQFVFSRVCLFSDSEGRHYVRVVSCTMGLMTMQTCVELRAGLVVQNPVSYGP